MTEVPYPLALERFPVIRQSTLSKFDDCALDASWSMEHETGWSSAPAARGQLVHHVIARCLRRLMVAQGESRIPVEVALAEFDEGLRTLEVEEPDAQAPPLREVAQARVDVICWAMGTEWSIDEVAGIERRLNTTVRYPDGTGGWVERTFSGRLDVLLIDASGEHAIVSDHKSSWAIPPEKQDDPMAVDVMPPEDTISDHGYFQQRAYGLLVFDNFPGVQRVVLREHYLRYANSPMIKPTREASIHRYQLEEIRSEFSALVERFDRAVQTGRWRATPSSHCVNCLMPWKCPILPEARKEGQIVTLADAEKVAGWIQVADAALRRYRKILRPWTDRHGPVRVKDAKRERYFGAVLRRHVDRPSRDELDWALSNGIDPRSLYREREVPTFTVFNAADMPPQAQEMAETERMLLAAEKRQRERGRDGK